MNEGNCCDETAGMCPTRLLHPRSQVKHLMTRKAAEFDVHVPPLSQLVDKEVRPALLSLRTRGSREDKAGCSPTFVLSYAKRGQLLCALGVVCDFGGLAV